jgi:hypothetical protein
LTIPARKHKRIIHPQYRKMFGYLSINVLPAIFAMVLVALFITVATNWNPSSCRDGYREVQQPVQAQWPASMVGTETETKCLSFSPI